MKSVWVFLCFFLFLFFSSGLISAHSSTSVIKMTGEGFEPSELSVDTDSTVIFVNQDTLDRWPASNLHPIHELYPEFDPKKAIKSGESWAFSPEKAGVWKYHDHLNPHLRASLTVASEEEKSSQSSPGSSFWQNLKTDLATFINKFVAFIKNPFAKSLSALEFKKLPADKQFVALTDMARKKGAKDTWSFVTETFKSESGSSGNIHDLAHLAGKLIYEELGVAGLSICSPTFAFGCYHGLLDSTFATSLSDLAHAEVACEKVGPVNSGPYGSCIHGIGHGIASFHQTKDMKAALTSCDSLSNGQQFCYDGVFMEFVRGAPNSFYSKIDPFYPCSNLEKESGAKYSVSCGRNQPSVFIQKLGIDFQESVTLCEKNNLSTQFKEACFDAVGFVLASTQDTQKIISGCGAIKAPNFSFLCLKSAAGELIFQEVPSWQEKSRQVCDSLSGNFKSLCHNNLQRLIKEYGRTSTNFIQFQKGQGKNDYIRSQMRICYKSGGSDDCYKKVASLFSDQFKLKEVLEIFAGNEESPEVFSRCHEVTHYLSRNEYSKVKSIAKVYANCDSTCHGGCYHGTLEAYLGEKNLGLGKDLFTHFPTICGVRENYGSDLVFNECLHGLGHAAMYITDMELPVSLSLCDTLQEGEPKERCYSGIFMENSSSSTNNDHPGKYVRSEDPLYPCNSLEEKYQKICWRYQSSYFAIITDHDWRKTADLCLKVPEHYQYECFLTVGTNQVGFTQDTALMRENCSLMPTENFRNVCIQGVVSSFAYRFVGNDKKMADFCNEVGSNYKESCFKQMGLAVKDWGRDKQKTLALCEKIENPRFSLWCKEGLGLDLN